MKTFKLDPKKFPKVRRNIIITYAVLALIGLGMVWLYLRDLLFGSAWGLIPFVVLIFALAGWFALRERRRYWDEFQLEVEGDSLIRFAPKTMTVRLKRPGITGIREVSQGLIVSTESRKNMLLIPRQLADEDYQAVKRILDSWVVKKV